MGGGKVLGGKFFIPGILNSGMRPLGGRGTGFGLLAMLIQTKSSVHNALSFLDRRPVEMKLLLFLFKFRLGLKVAAERSISFRSRSSDIDDQLFVLGCLR